MGWDDVGPARGQIFRWLIDAQKRPVDAFREYLGLRAGRRSREAADQPPGAGGMTVRAGAQVGLKPAAFAALQRTVEITGDEINCLLADHILATPHS